MDLLERASALDELATALAAGGGMVLVAGEAGIGKSALVRRFAQQHRADARLLVGGCDPLLTPRALGPLHDIARQTGGLLADLLAAQAPREAVFSAFLGQLESVGPLAGRRLLVTEVLAAEEPGVPATVRDLMLARLSRLALAEREVARFVAVIPGRAELWVVERSLGADWSALEACVAAGTLTLTEGTVGFRHELARQAVEGSLSALGRRELNRCRHRQIGVARDFEAFERRGNGSGRSADGNPAKFHLRETRRF